MAFVHGKNAQTTLGGFDISAYLNKSELDQALELADVTTFTVNQTVQAARQYLGGLYNRQLPIDGIYDTTGFGSLSTMFNAGTAQAYTYGPAGTASGSYKQTGSAYIDSLKVVAQVGDAIQISGNLTITGTVVNTTF